IYYFVELFFFSSRRRHTRSKRDWSSDVCSSDLQKGSNKQSTTYFDKIEVSKRRGLAMQHEERIAVTQTKKSLGKDVPEKPFKGRSEERRVGKECKWRRGREE